MKQKIIIPSAVAAVALAIVGFTSVGITDEIQTPSLEVENPDSTKISMTIEDNNYVAGGLLPPDRYILDFGDGLDLEDDKGENSPYYNDVKGLFSGYDEIVIIDHKRVSDDPNYVTPFTTYIFLTKKPFEYETHIREFYYNMVGISITIIENMGREKYTMQYEKDAKSVYKEISDDLIGIGREKFKGPSADGTEIDVPTELTFVDDKNVVYIKGFLTLDQASELAKAVRR